MEPILDIHVITRDAAELDAGAAGSVVMIPFGGTVTGSVFEGIVEPCGVDTQVVNTAGVRHMSARYMLTGRTLSPMEGAAHIYIENNGWFQGNPALPFTTTPTSLTDHRELAKMLSRPIIGKGFVEKDGLHIRFYFCESADSQEKQ